MAELSNTNKNKSLSTNFRIVPPEGSLSYLKWKIMIISYFLFKVLHARMIKIRDIIQRHPGCYRNVAQAHNFINSWHKKYSDIVHVLGVKNRNKVMSKPATRGHCIGLLRDTVETYKFLMQQRHLVRIYPAQMAIYFLGNPQNTNKKIIVDFNDGKRGFINENLNITKNINVDTAECLNKEIKKIAKTLKKYNHPLAGMKKNKTLETQIKNIFSAIEAVLDTDKGIGASKMRESVKKFKMQVNTNLYLYQNLNSERQILFQLLSELEAIHSWGDTLKNVDAFLMGSNFFKNSGDISYKKS